VKVINRVLALILALAVILGAAVLIIEVIAVRVGSATRVLNWHRFYDWAADTTWGAAPVRIAAVLLLLIGLAIIVSQVRRRRPDRLAITGDNRATDAAITRRGITHTVRHAVIGVDGVSKATVGLRRRLTVRGFTHAGAADAESVTRTAQAAVDGLNLSHPPQLTVHMTSRER